jgi:hypothetical protein
MFLIVCFCLVLGMVVLTDEQRAHAVKRIREALRMADISVSKAALWMNLELRDLERGFSCERKLDVFRLEMLPDAFHQYYALVSLRDRGLPPLSLTSLMVGPRVSFMQQDTDD